MAQTQSTQTDDPTGESGKDRVAKVRQAAHQFLESLSDEQREAVLFPYDDEKQRRNWSNLPNGMVRRKGLRWGELTTEQQDLVSKMIQATMSQRGYQQVVDNMRGDEVLRRQVAARGGERQPDFGSDAYYVSLLGEPSDSEPWMWQFGGHHLAINATIQQDDITLSPSLTGGQPIRFEWEGESIEQLAAETRAAFEMVNSLSPDQKEQAIISAEPANMIWGPGTENPQPKQEGIAAASLSQEQREQLLNLIRLRIGILNPVHSQKAMKDIEEHLDQTWFAWFGPTQKGSAASYRIQGPTVLIEYSPQQLGGDPTEHTHAMYRDPSNDYGRPVR